MIYNNISVYEFNEHVFSADEPAVISHEVGSDWVNIIALPLSRVGAYTLLRNFIINVYPHIFLDVEHIQSAIEKTALHVQIHFQSEIIPIVNKLALLFGVAMTLGRVWPRKAANTSEVLFVSDQHLVVSILSENQWQFRVVFLILNRQVLSQCHPFTFRYLYIGFLITPHNPSHSFT